MARVLIVDDHRLFSGALRAMLEGEGITVVGVASSGSEAFKLVDETTPDLILMDLGLPDVDGIDAAESILHKHPDVKIVILTARRDARVMKQALAAGLSGYLTKDTQMDRFLTSLRAAIGGDVVIQSGLARSAAGERSPELREAAFRLSQLTPREREVLDLLAQGFSSEDMTSELRVSPHTVRTHVHNILTKLQVRSRLEAAAFAARHDLDDHHAYPASRSR